MPMWSDALKEEMAALPVEAAFEPVGEVDPLESVAGVLDEELRRLYFLALTWERKGLEKSVQAKFTYGEDARSATFAEANVYREKYEAAMRFFWASVRDNFGLWGKNVAIRKGWQVVATEDFLSGLAVSLRSLLDG